ncbi:asparagine synthase (glutamine-hydrolyzing) [Paraburkholderia sp.]|uniref:asparagine synthase (glutamine-hydrolyzing) n=1 Tax=Paraburkholderia sp. TaxID=1926495 RepID=UPI00286F0DF3|nr:asparagine synthase (glutamine-hydrolyzing) [Paraburkholderia sp.]
MCGFIFIEQSEGQVGLPQFERALSRQAWRGPDHSGVMVESGGRFLLGHNRLSIIDPESRSHQPMRSACGRYVIVFNGEIYNHKELRQTLELSCQTLSDTETLLEAYAKIGDAVFPLLDGMFAVAILDVKTGRWVAARDPFGIKPLYFYRSSTMAVFASEAASVGQIVGASIDHESVEEWRLIRRPTPGHSFFQRVHELLPGHCTDANGRTWQFWQRSASNEPYTDEAFAQYLRESVRAHELSDCQNVALLSGGLDSAVITAISSVEKTYTVGLSGNNEFAAAEATAVELSKSVVQVELAAEQLQRTWSRLARLRGEPLSVPNEGLIFEVCNAMDSGEKVVLTGEGADELLFGYDKIFRWAAKYEWSGFDDFMARYGYGESSVLVARLRNYVERLRKNKSNLEFLEDWFYDVHLTGLLRRMDFASMAASREARVPFVNKRLVTYMYRRAVDTKLDDHDSKLPLRRMVAKLGLSSVLDRKKIGFSATMSGQTGRFDEYRAFQQTNLAALGWEC